MAFILGWRALPGRGDRARHGWCRAGTFPPAVLGRVCPGVGREDGAHVSRHRPDATARPSAARNSCSPWAARRVFSSAHSSPGRVLPAVAAPVMNASATGPSARTPSRERFWPAPPTRCRPRAAVVLIEYRDLTGRGGSCVRRRPLRSRLRSPAAGQRRCATWKLPWAVAGRHRHRRRPGPRSAAGHRSARRTIRLDR